MQPNLALSDFADQLRRDGIRRVFFVWDAPTSSVRASHPGLAPLARWLQTSPDFAEHEGFFLELAPDTDVLFGACVHRTNRGQGAGGVRNWRYDTIGDFLVDGLRLAQGMTHKNALAGLWWGGGKGQITRGLHPEEDRPDVRRAIYEGYGRFITSLRGCYVTAEDVGTSVDDMAAIFRTTRFTTCIPETLGGSGNPSVPTARGVVRGMEAALTHRGMGTLEGKRVALQGVGHVGAPLVELLLEAGVARVIGADVDPAAREVGTLDERVEIRIVEAGDQSILAEDVDILAPCAVGGTLDEITIPTIVAAIVCGAANNQLRNPVADDARLRAAGISYVPDFLVNRMGIVHCADEASGTIVDDPAFDAHLGTEDDNSIYRLTRQVLEEADRDDVPPGRIALRLAEARSREPHPIWPHRSRQIIASLVRGGWAIQPAPTSSPV